MNIEIIEASQKKEKPDWSSDLGFGNIFTDHMFTMDWTAEQGWCNAKIEPYAPICMDPASLVLHYAQETFEGLKAYKTKDGRVLLFRPEMNARRFANSNRRLCMKRTGFRLPRVPHFISARLCLRRKLRLGYIQAMPTNS